MNAVNNQAPSCCMCAEISSGQFPDDFSEVYGSGSRICCENTGFVTLPTVSPLCAGHALILPREHVTCLSGLSMRLRGELLDCVETVRGQLAKRYGSQFYFFEHGTRSAGLACGIDHAHLHVLPLSAEIADKLDVSVEADFSADAIAPFEDILSTAARTDGRAYLLRGSKLDRMRISFDDRIPSQYMRRIIADLESRSDWDWKFLSGQLEFRSTYEALTIANDPR
jgi:diadenosine tetraphosphate (Ap4A) HIT family hydrolase